VICLLAILGFLSIRLFYRLAKFFPARASQKLSASAEFHARRVRCAGRGEPQVPGRGKSRLNRSGANQRALRRNTELGKFFREGAAHEMA
jgi:hypothetical protein